MSAKSYRHKAQIEFTSNSPQKWADRWRRLDEKTDAEGAPRNVVVTYLEDPKEPVTLPRVGEFWRTQGGGGSSSRILAVSSDENFVVLRSFQRAVAWQLDYFLKGWERDS